MNDQAQRGGATDDPEVLRERIAAGDARAFARWLALSETRLRLSLRRFAAQVDVEAVVQETLLRVWQVAPRVTAHPQGETLLRLAIRIARNLAIDEVRRRRPQATAPELVERAIEDDLVPSAPGMPDPVLRRTIVACRETLPRRPAQVFEARLRSGGGDHDRELATRLNMKLNTFLQNFTRARRLLAQCLEKHGVRVTMTRGGQR